MNPLARVLILIAAVIVLYLSGCSRPVYVRVFNYTSSPIRLLGSGGDAPVDVPPGASARVFLSSITRGRDHGFVVVDSGSEKFYVVASHLADGSLAYPLRVSFPSVSRKSKTMAPEFFVEYSDSMIFAVDASNEAEPRRLNPQPPGFPLKPNKAPATVFRKQG